MPIYFSKKRKKKVKEYQFVKVPFRYHEKDKAKSIFKIKLLSDKVNISIMSFIFLIALCISSAIHRLKTK